MKNPSSYIGAPHAYEVGDRVWVEIGGGTYNGHRFPGYKGWVIITERKRSRRDSPLYYAEDEKGTIRGFGEWAVIDPPADMPASLKDEAKNIADYLTLDSIENDKVAEWVELLRRYADE